VGPLQAPDSRAPVWIGCPPCGLATTPSQEARHEQQAATVQAVRAGALASKRWRASSASAIRITGHALLGSHGERPPTRSRAPPAPARTGPRRSGRAMPAPITSH
jgi:hypothetical protein